MHPCPSVPVIELKAQSGNKGIKSDAFPAGRRYLKPVHKEIHPGDKQRPLAGGDGEQQGEVCMLQVRLALVCFKICIWAIAVGGRQDIDIGLGRPFQATEKQGQEQKC